MTYLPEDERINTLIKIDNRPTFDFFSIVKQHDSRQLFAGRIRVDVIPKKVSKLLPKK